MGCCTSKTEAKYSKERPHLERSEGPQQRDIVET